MPQEQKGVHRYFFFASYPTLTLAVSTIPFYTLPSCQYKHKVSYLLLTQLTLGCFLVEREGCLLGKSFLRIAVLLL